ncbi:MAG: hypothetical protein PWR30_541 [Candidatus Woesearchaeota archaeon]|nr:hypothetical protein [Candidatus Woesearchaeota archaeon]
MKHLNAFYDIDDTLLESLDLFFFVDNLMALEYLKKIRGYEKNEDFNEILSDLPDSLSKNKKIEQYLAKQPEIKELNDFKADLRKADDIIMEKWPQQGKNPFSLEGYKTALEEIVDKYSLNLDDESINALSKIPFHYRLKKKYPLESIKELLKESLEFDVNLYILSKGSFKEQARKLENIKLNEIIPLKNLYILQKKDKNALYEIIDYECLDNLLIIGNSLKEDILPAIDLDGINARALWVRHEDYFSKGLNSKDKIENKIEEFSDENFLKAVKSYLYD